MNKDQRKAWLEKNGSLLMPETKIEWIRVNKTEYYGLFQELKDKDKYIFDLEFFIEQLINAYPDIEEMSLYKELFG